MGRCEPVLRCVALGVPAECGLERGDRSRIGSLLEGGEPEQVLRTLVAVRSECCQVGFGGAEAPHPQERRRSLDQDAIPIGHRSRQIAARELGQWNLRPYPVEGRAHRGEDASGAHAIERIPRMPADHRQRHL